MKLVKFTRSDMLEKAPISIKIGVMFIVDLYTGRKSDPQPVSIEA